MIEVKVEGLEELTKKFAAMPQALGREMRVFWEKTIIKAQEKAAKRFLQKGEALGGGRPHVRTGLLRTSLFKGGLQNITEIDPAPIPLWAKIGTRVYYAPYVELGTGPHEIKAVHKKALRFEIDGREIFRKRVHHPGSRPHSFLVAGIEESKEDRDRYLAEAGNHLQQEWDR